MTKMSVEKESSWKYNRKLQKNINLIRVWNLEPIYIRATVLYVVKTN